MFAASKTSTAVSAAVADPFFNNVTALVNTSGTNGAQNNTFIDSSTNNFTITRNGNTTQGSFSPYGENWSNFFDGTGDYLSLTTNAAFGYGTGAFTIECWFNTQAIPPSGGDYLFDQRTTGSQAALAVYISPNAALEVFVNGATVITGGTVVVNQWNHFALAKSGTTTRMFLNGAQVGSSYTDNVNYVSTAPVVIGSRFTAQDFYQGYISNFRIIKGTALYTANFTPPTAPLQPVAGTSLLTCQSPGIVDDSPNQFTITRTGDVSVQRFSPFALPQPYTPAVFGGSAYFDGAGDYLTAPVNAAFNFETGDFTIEAWINFASVGITQNIINNYNGTGTAGWGLQWRTDPARYSFFYGDTSILAFASVPLINTWNHVAVSRFGTTLRMFLNGVQVATVTNSTNLTSTLAVAVGNLFASGQGYAFPYFGYMSNVRVIKGTALYTSSFVPQNAPLTAVTNTSLLLNATNAGIYDASTLNVFETLGNAQVSTSVKKYGTSSVALDGTGDYLITSSAVANPVLALGTGAFTIEFWFYANSNSGTQQLFDTRPVGVTSTSRYMAIIYLSGSLNYYTAGANPAIAGGVVAPGDWNYVTLTRSGTSTRLFINGVQVGSTYTDSQDYLIGINRPIIGADGASPATANFAGYIQDLRITRGIARYTANFTPPTAPLPTF